MYFSSIFIALSIFLSCGSNQAIADPPQEDKTYRVEKYINEHKLSDYAQAIFAGGCFWCTEACFERIDGVVDVISGYSGGHKDFPEYYEVGKGITGHTEAIYIFYDPQIIDYETLLNVLFIAHDPTTLNRQGPDVGEEYRSAIYYKTPEELRIIEKVINEVNAKSIYDNKIVTEIAPYKEFWVAEYYHQNYYELNPDNGYVARVSKPKVEKIIKTFPELLKKKYRK